MQKCNSTKIGSIRSEVLRKNVKHRQKPVSLEEFYKTDTRTLESQPMDPVQHAMSFQKDLGERKIDQTRHHTLCSSVRDHHS